MPQTLSLHLFSDMIEECTIIIAGKQERSGHVSSSLDGQTIIRGSPTMNGGMGSALVNLEYTAATVRRRSIRGKEGEESVFRSVLQHEDDRGETTLLFHVSPLLLIQVPTIA